MASNFSKPTQTHSPHRMTPRGFLGARDGKSNKGLPNVHKRKIQNRTDTTGKTGAAFSLLLNWLGGIDFNQPVSKSHTAKQGKTLCQNQTVLYSIVAHLF
jgi:hypothetical protein